MHEKLGKNVLLSCRGGYFGGKVIYKPQKCRIIESTMLGALPGKESDMEHEELHTHAHTHEHTHEHTHDGITHSHPHTHEHSHEHLHEGAEHTHGHVHDHLHADGAEHQHEHTAACGEHIHCGEGVNCADCGHEHLSPKQELMGLMQYMINHNTAHANELAGLAKQLRDMGDAVSYEQVMLAVSDFEKGNLRLSTVLASLKA